MTTHKRRESPFTLRMAVPADHEQVLNLALQIPQENTDYFPGACPVKVSDKLEELTRNNTLLVYENNGRIVGILGVVIDSFWWSDEPQIMDAIFYVDPDFRSFSAYRRMLSAVEEIAKLNKLPLSLLFFTTKDTKRKFDMVLRRGYKPVGFWVMKKE